MAAMLDQLPGEIFSQVVVLLLPQDLKSLRLVNKTLSEDLVPALFSKVDISCLTLKRLENIAFHPVLSHAVHEFHYHEMSSDYAPGGLNSNSWLRSVDRLEPQSMNTIKG